MTGDRRAPTESQEEWLRRLEVETLSGVLPSRGVCLEIGGGTGWQASLLSARGLQVVSVDLSDRDRVSAHFEVVDYDGVHLPMDDGSVDAIWSSNVLEHVEALPDLLAEMARVAAPGAVAVHVLPTPWWRLWSTIVYPFAVAKRQLRQAPPGGAGAAGGLAAGPPRTFGQKLKGLVLPGPHGAAPSAMSELTRWQIPAWRSRLEVEGWKLDRVIPLGLFYSGNAFAPDLSARTRTLLGRLLGSATRAYVLRRGPAT